MIITIKQSKDSIKKRESFPDTMEFLKYQQSSISAIKLPIPWANQCFVFIVRLFVFFVCFFCFFCVFFFGGGGVVVVFFILFHFILFFFGGGVLVFVVFDLISPLKYIQHQIGEIVSLLAKIAIMTSLHHVLCNADIRKQHPTCRNINQFYDMAAGFTVTEHRVSLAALEK